MFYKKFDSVEEFYRDSVPGFPPPVYNDMNFIGVRNLEEIEERAYSWEKGVEEIELNTTMPTGRTKMVYSHDDGDSMNYERYRDDPDLPFMIKRVNDPDNTGSGKYCDIILNICESCNVKAYQMLNKTRAAMSIVDSLESQDIRCKIILYCGEVDMTKKGDHRTAIKITVKDYESPLNIGLLATVFSPWFFRYHIFHWQQKHFPEALSNHFGKPRSYRMFKNSIDEMDKNFTPPDYELIIDKGECLDQYGIDQKIKELNNILTQ